MENFKKEDDKIQHLIISGCFGLLFIVAILYYVCNSSKSLIEIIGNFSGEVLPDFFATLVGVLFVYYLLTRKGINPNQKIRDAITENKKVMSKIEEDIQITKENLNISDKIYSLLNNKNNEFKKLMAQMLTAHPFAKGLSSFMVDGFLSRFEEVSKGIKIKDEYFSLYAYIHFWEYLSEQQAIRKSKGEDKIIARILHSNSIHIWTNENERYKDLSVEIYRWKKKFVANGGIIVRILIGKEDTPNADYLKAMKEMEKCGIEVKYLKKPRKIRLPYDFLLLYDENFIAKWKSDTDGDALSESEYIDSLDKDVASKWQHLFFALKDSGNAIKSIPKEREFFFNN